MSNREDITGGSASDLNKLHSGLIYTKKCGWIDLSHATVGLSSPMLNNLMRLNNGKTIYNRGIYNIKNIYPSLYKIYKTEGRSQFTAAEIREATVKKNTRNITTKFEEEETRAYLPPPVGAAAGLMGAVLANPHFFRKSIDFGDFYFLSYDQSMATSVADGSYGNIYVVKTGLSPQKIKSIALAILMDVSYGFENYQTKFEPYTGSGFSGEDLVSDRLSLYRSLNPDLNYIELMEPVDKETALAIWDIYGGLGKNRDISKMILHPIPSASTVQKHKNNSLDFVATKKTYPSNQEAPLPDFLNTVTAAQEGNAFFTLRTGILNENAAATTGRLGMGFIRNMCKVLEKYDPLTY